jgi:hypothetical protein
MEAIRLLCGVSRRELERDCNFGGLPPAALRNQESREEQPVPLPTIDQVRKELPKEVEFLFYSAGHPRANLIFLAKPSPGLR